MRVSEFAKSLKLPAGIVLGKAKAMGCEVTSTLSSLEPAEVTELKNYFAKLDLATRTQMLADYEAAHAARKAKGETARTEEAKKNREAVDAAHRHALAAQAHKGENALVPESEPVKDATTSLTPAVELAKDSEPAPAVKVEPAAKKVPTEVEIALASGPAMPSVSVTLSDGGSVEDVIPDSGAADADLQPKPVTAPKRPVVEDDDDPVAGILVHGAREKTHLPLKPHVGARVDNTRGGAARSQRNDRQNDRRGTQTNRFGKKPGGVPSRVALTGTTAAHASVNGKVLQLRAPVTVKELAELLGMRPNMLIADLMRLNVLASINQHLELEVTQKIASKYGFTVEMEERSKRSSERKPVLKGSDADDDIPEDLPEAMKLRPPVVTFLGHVDHGKTTLMDYIRSAHVANGEAGGITQHIAAYTIAVPHKDEEGNDRLITFIDTPGHAAFSAMRERGANITDIAVIIVAADDGVMPQTKEAIKHARLAGVQMLVAITKCDKPDARPDRVRQMLQGEGLTPEEWGGDTVCCEVSGQTGAGVENLLDMILLQADVLELQANPNRRANGAVIESQLEQGLGPTATLLIQGGSLHVGDIVLCDEYYGKVRALIDERGQRVQVAGPSIAVKCTGLSGVPDAGSTFRVMLNEKRARELAERSAEENKMQSLSAAQTATMADWTSRLGVDGMVELGIILKADTQGTAEAVEASLRAILSKKVTLKILYVGVGSIAAADVQRAGGDGGAVIIGFNVSCEPGVQTVARQNGVRINTFRIIYELLEHVKRCMLDLIAPEFKEVVRGHAEIRQVFDISKLGMIAGCQMIDGLFRFKNKYRIFRGKTIVFDGKLHTMKHFKDDVTEVTGAQECGLGFGSYEAFQEGDLIECYEMEELPKTL
ncbi:MAG: translation initiation factor IF-2 [Kiritimatiellia bacterium]